MTDISREAVERTICNPIINYVHDGRHPTESGWAAMIDMARALRDALDKAEADKKELALQVTASEGQAQDAYEAQVKAEAERDAAWNEAIEVAAELVRNNAPLSQSTLDSMTGMQILDNIILVNRSHSAKKDAAEILHLKRPTGEQP